MSVDPERQKQEPIIGSYNKVSLAEKEIDLEIPLDAHRKGSRLFSWLRGKRSLGNIWDEQTQLAVSVVLAGRVSRQEVERLPIDYKTRSDKIQQIDTLYALASAYEQRKQTMRSETYDFGLTLSDFFEIIPRSTAAVFLYIASDPDIAQDVLDHQKGLGLETIDVQKIAVEVSVLLPTEARHEIFVEMAKLDPRLEGRAYGLFRSIVANFHQRNSEFCGSSLIYANLTGDRASGKILEVQNDFADLGELIRQQFA